MLVLWIQNKIIAYILEGTTKSIFFLLQIGLT